MAAGSTGAASPHQSMADMLLGFESLGGGGLMGGCEFGLMQREYGLEPLSLLRWVSVEPDDLADLLERRCDGVGDPDHMEILPQGHYDWRFIDRRYKLRMDHTHLSQATVERETARQMMVKRMRFLSRKLMSDLETGEKIFVYRMTGGGIAPASVERLRRAVASYGDSRLVLVAEAESDEPVFDVQSISQRCVLITRNVLERPGKGVTKIVKAENWRRICQAAVEYFSARMP
jgi:hypothetical protein